MIAYLYLFILFVLEIYSFSQIDLNLTLFQNQTFLSFQNTMIQLGYFNRPLSLIIFLLILTVLSFLYILLFRKPPKEVKILIIGIAFLGILSYPAFSHDIFNYIFDARIFVAHGQNPYTHTALMFPTDDWTRFMNWTHRTYPYGPTFLPISIFFYLIGFGKFILTLLSFKLMSTMAFIGSSVVIGKLAGKKGLIFFALNPLIIFEVIVAAHLDIVMLFFALLAWYFLIQKKKAASFISLLVSAGIKYSTIILLPAFIFKSLKLAVLLAFLGAGIQVLSREILPHYLIVPIGFVALMPESKKVVKLTIALSILLLVVRYYSFISSGVWGKIY